MAGGIAPSLLLSQVQNTCAWALDGDAPWQRYLRDAPALEERWQEPEHRGAYLSLLLSAHFATVATFVPTDVDTRIRHHAWAELPRGEGLRAALDRVDEAASWDPRAVSERAVHWEDLGTLCGHDGEWFSVRAGALGRALQVRDEESIERLVSALDAEVSREAQCFLRVERAPGRELDALRVATILAHNLGDLSRVVTVWPAKGERAAGLAARYARLGHEDASREDEEARALRRAGALNKAVMAAENHRFLVLRKPRGLRRSRAFLLPIGPFFDAWGERLGAARELSREERGAVLAALLEGHDGDPAQQGYLRALAGMHRTAQGGLEALASEVPARLRKLLSGGVVREALKVRTEAFEARMAAKARR